MEARIITDLQYGSCGKRLFTEFYANLWQPTGIVSNGLPNSGGYDSNKVKWSAIPIGFPADIYISPGSALDLKTFTKEALRFNKICPGFNIYVHENTAIVSDKDLADEEKFVRIGSTMTGGMAAVVRKMERDPEATGTIADHFRDELSEYCRVVTTGQWLKLLRMEERILGLCAQGHSLSINFGFHPYCTSRNTSPAQLIADAGIAPQVVTKILGCARVFPIRVANRYDENDEMIGWSGPIHSDQFELDWEKIGVEPERTSISNKVRRVFTFSDMQIEEAVQVTGCTDIFLNFLNYLPTENLKRGMMLRASDHGARVTFTGHGPTIADIRREW